MISHIVSSLSAVGGIVFLVLHFRRANPEQEKTPTPEFIASRLCLALCFFGQLLKPGSLEHPDIWFWLPLLLVVLLFVGIYRDYRSVYAKRKNT